MTYLLKFDIQSNVFNYLEHGHSNLVLLTFGGDSLLWGTVLQTVGCVAEFLDSTHLIPVASSTFN